MKTAGNAKRRQLENGNSSNYKSIQTRHPFSAFRQQLCTLRRSSLPQPQIFCAFTDVSLDVVRFWYAWASTNQAELDRTRTENRGVKNASTKCWPLIHGGLQSHTSQAPPQYWLVRSSSAFFCFPFPMYEMQTKKVPSKEDGERRAKTAKRFASTFHACSLVVLLLNAVPHGETKVSE